MIFSENRLLLFGIMHEGHPERPGYDLSIVERGNRLRRLARRWLRCCAGGPAHRIALRALGGVAARGPARVVSGEPGRTAAPGNGTQGASADRAALFIPSSARPV